MPMSKPSQLQRHWVAYCRKSTDTEDKQVHTLDDQEKMAREYYESLPASEKKNHPLKLLREARSAYKLGRPEFGKLLDMADKGEIYGVIVAQVNRISRNHADSGAFTQRLVEGKIERLDTAVERRHYHADDSNSIFMLTLEGVNSWKDSKDKSVRVKHAMKERAKEGKLMGRKPLGYLPYVQPDGKRETIVDEARAPMIRSLFALAATGVYSLKELATKAHEMGLVTRREKKITPSILQNLLRDPAYKGWVPFDGETHRNGQHPALVSEDLWNKVQIMLSGRSRDTARPQSFSLRERFIFGSKVKCGKCGRVLSPYRVKKKMKDYTYYECKNPDSKCQNCISQAALVEQMDKQFLAIELGKSELEKVREHLLRIHAEKSKGETEQRKAINVEYEKVKDRIGDLLDERKQAEEMGVEEEWREKMGKLRERRDLLQAQLNAVHDEGNAWIDRLVGCFEQLRIAKEALTHGSPQIREAVLMALASNHSVIDGNLVLDWRSPYMESSQKEEHPEWWAILDSNQ